MHGNAQLLADIVLPLNFLAMVHFVTKATPISGRSQLIIVIIVNCVIQGHRKVLITGQAKINYL